jgi:hypothetical protein
MPNKNLLFFMSVSILLAFGCKKETITEKVSIPSYSEIPTVLVENYINRIYIDLLGREPLDIEMDSEVTFLRSGELSINSRIVLIKNLQQDTTFREGEINYRHAYYNQLYNKCKGRMIEGASAYEINHEINLLSNAIGRDTNTVNDEAVQLLIYERQKLIDVIEAEELMRLDSITIGNALGKMADNKIYDIINMNTVNFLDASFDNLFFRFPTNHERNVCFDIVEFNESSILWGRPAQNKKELIDLWINSLEFLNGQVIWLYQSLYARVPNTAEMAYGMDLLRTEGNIQKLEQKIMSTDEYAHFTYQNK